MNKSPNRLVIFYCGLIAICLLIMLLGQGGFDYGPIKFETPGLAVVNILGAALVVFALPFLLNLTNNLASLRKLALIIGAAVLAMQAIFTGILWFIALAVVVFGLSLLSILQLRSSRLPQKKSK